MSRDRHGAASQASGGRGAIADALRVGSIAAVALAVGPTDSFIRNELMHPVHEGFGSAIAAQVTEATSSRMVLAAATTQHPAMKS